MEMFTQSDPPGMIVLFALRLSWRLLYIVLEPRSQHVVPGVCRPPAGLGQEALQLGPEARVHPAVHDGIGEAGGHGRAVTKAEQQVESPLVKLKDGIRDESEV